MGDHLDNAVEGVITVDCESRVADTNTVALELLNAKRDSFVGADIGIVFPESVESTFHQQYGDEESDRLAVEFEEYFPELEMWLAVRGVPSDDDLLLYIRDITEQKDQERELATRVNELATLDRITGIIQDLVRSLVGTVDREDIERTVCERLADSELYEFAWIGQRQRLEADLVLRIAEGEYGELLDRIVDSEDQAENRLEDRAIETGEGQLSRELATDSDLPEPMRREAFGRGVQSGIAVPLTYGDTVYGVLGVYATRPEAFSKREQGAFETLGEIAGFAINAAKQRRLLLSDTVVEIAFRVTDRSSVLTLASTRLDCTITVKGIVPRSDQSLLCYVQFEGATPSEITDIAPELVTGRTINEYENGGLLEVTLIDASPLLTLAGHGATIQEAIFKEGIGRIVSEVAPDEDVRDIVEDVTTTFPETELIVKQERERTVETTQAFRSELHNELTDRQRTGLRTAYLADYFESPRGSTAEEIATTLDITSPTLHHHLRAGQRKLLSAFFDEDNS